MFPLSIVEMDTGQIWTTDTIPKIMQLALPTELLPLDASSVPLDGMGRKTMASVRFLLVSSQHTNGPGKNFILVRKLSSTSVRLLQKMHSAWLQLKNPKNIISAFVLPATLAVTARLTNVKTSTGNNTV